MPLILERNRFRIRKNLRDIIALFSEEFCDIWTISRISQNFSENNSRSSRPYYMFTKAYNVKFLKRLWYKKYQFSTCKKLWSNISFDFTMRDVIQSFFRFLFLVKFAVERCWSMRALALNIKLRTVKIWQHRYSLYP